MKRTLLPLAAALVTFACGDSQPTAPAASADAAARQSRSESGCRDVRGAIVERITGPNTAAGTITGDVSGDVSIVITALRQMGGGVMEFDAQCTMVTRHGTFNTTDRATLTPIEAPLYRVSNRLEVTGGTGEYSGVTGTLHTHGTANFVPGGLVDLRYYGQLCKRQ
jgi:hypothetical protein